jgi:hypothetical protein
MSVSRRAPMALVCVLVAYVAYAGAFVYRTSFVINGERYFSLFDDAMISMRYARNLAGGYGLVWNPDGVRIEGYTNLLWTLYMAALHLLPVAESKVSLLVQLTSLLALALNVVVIARIARALAPDSALAGLGAALLSAFYLPLNNWGLQGMEVGLLALVISSSVWYALQCFDGVTVPRALYPLLGLGLLVRLDMLVPFVALLAAMLLYDPRKRRQHLVLGGSILVCALGGQTVLRYAYYGELLPNTYYLKMTGYPVGWRVARGLLVCGEWAARWLLGALLLLPALRAVPRDRRTGLLVGVCAAQVAYSIYVGGDAWERSVGSNRYVSVVMPLLFVLLAVGVAGLERAWTSGGRRHARPIVVGMLGVTLITVNWTTAGGALRVVALLERPLHVVENESKVRTALILKQITTPDATVAVVWAGAEPYFMHRTAIDLLGKTDPRIAHELMRQAPTNATRLEAATFFWPGHRKYDYAYSIGQLQPDVVAQLWLDAEEARPYLDPAYGRITIEGQTVFLRKGSRSVKWELVRHS